MATLTAADMQADGHQQGSLDDDHPLVATCACASMSGLRRPVLRKRLAVAVLMGAGCMLGTWSPPSTAAAHGFDVDLRRGTTIAVAGTISGMANLDGSGASAGARLDVSRFFGDGRSRFEGRWFLSVGVFAAGLLADQFVGGWVPEGGVSLRTGYGALFVEAACGIVGEDPSAVASFRARLGVGYMNVATFAAGVFWLDRTLRVEAAVSLGFGARVR